MRKKISIAIMIIVLLLSSVMIVGSNYYSREYAQQEFDQILFYIFNGVGGTAQSVVKEVITSNIVPVIIAFAVLLFLTKSKSKKTIFLKLRFKSKKIRIQLFPIKVIVNHKIIYTIVVLIISIIATIKGFKIDKYIKHNVETTNIYEEQYVDGNIISITFPEQKRNLIFISVESMETTLCSKENGGGWEYSIIPELEQLELDYINFSNTDKLGGPSTVYGTAFTSGGLVAETAGIPLVTPAYKNNDNTYYGRGEYLKNAYTLGDILEKEGYNQEIMMGSEGEFGGRAQYFTTNGNYKIFDYNYAVSTGKMTAEERQWWGFTDDKLFAWAKEEISALANEDKPFNILVQTADTHFVDGWLSDKAEQEYPTQYENVHAYSSKSIYEFVNWVQEQSFYENTTIVILGDHLGMQSEFYKEHIEPDYERTVYNVIINSAIEATNTKNRVFNTMDMFPTILASMGVTIEGNRIGLGTNLFTGDKTLMEELGKEYFISEMDKRSNFYNNVILGEDYYLTRNAVGGE